MFRSDLPVSLIISFLYRVQDICLSYLELLERNNIIPLVVFDGLPLPGKKEECDKRARYQIILTLCLYLSIGVIITSYNLCCTN